MFTEFSPQDSNSVHQLKDLSLQTAQLDLSVIMERAYTLARAHGSYTFGEDGLDCPLFIKSNGQISSSLPLASGEKLGVKISVGLPAVSKDPRIHKLTFDPRESGFWVQFSASNLHNQRCSIHVLISDTLNGAAAILKSVSEVQRLLYLSYKSAKAGNLVTFEEAGRDFPEAIGKKGTLSNSFLLPTGDTLGAQVNIGLPTFCENPKLLDLSYDMNSKGYWLRFSGTDKHKVLKYTIVLVSESLTGRAAILKYFDPFQKFLFDSYEFAKRNHSIYFKEGGVECPELISNLGRLQHSFLLPSGAKLGSTGHCGLPQPCTDPRLHRIDYSPLDNGFWLSISGLDKNNVRSYSYLLVSDNAEALNPVPLTLNPSQKTFFDLYAIAKRVGTLDCETIGLNCSEYIGVNGEIKRTFVLPNGSTLKTKVRIGMPSSITNPKLHQIIYDQHTGTFQLRFSVENQNSETTICIIELSESLSGKKAISNWLSFNEMQFTLYEAYTKAKSNGSYSFPSDGIDGTLFIQENGVCKKSLILPNGSHIGVCKSIGLPSRITKPLIHDIGYSLRDCGFWIKISGIDQRGRRCFTSVLISEISDGENAILGFQKSNEIQDTDKFNPQNTLMDLAILITKSTSAQEEASS